MTDESATLLNQLSDNEVVVRSSRSEAFKGLAAGLIVTVGFAWATVRGASAGGPYAWMVLIIGLSNVLLFAALTVWAWKWWRSPPAMLIITADGLIQSPESRRPKVLPWGAIRAFEIVFIGGRELLVIEPRDYESEWRSLSRVRRFQLRLGSFMGRAQVRPVMAIPGGLEIELEELARVLAARTGAVQKE